MVFRWLGADYVNPVMDGQACFVKFFTSCKGWPGPGEVTSRRERNFGAAVWGDLKGFAGAHHFRDGGCPRISGRDFSAGGCLGGWAFRCSGMEHPNDPLHGVTLEAVLRKMVDRYGWGVLADRIPIRCFMFDPTIKSSLTFLRKTPWARKKLEDWYVYDAVRGIR